MGIKNFKMYVERFFGTHCFQEFDVQNVCCNIKDFSLHEIYRPPATTQSSSDSGYERCGVYVDLASYVYGRLLKSLETTEQYGRILSSINECATLKKTVVCELDTRTIDKIVSDCRDMVIGRLMPLLMKAYRVYFAYDTYSPQNKIYEQNARRKRSHFTVSSASREACYNKLATALRDYVVRAHFDDDTAVSVRRETMKSAMELKFEPDTSFQVGEGEWKCFYRIHEDLSNNKVDCCYIFGHDWDVGYAMTMYQHPKNPQAIKYVYDQYNAFVHRKVFDRKERLMHFICLNLFGNDYVSGLVNLSVTNAVLMKRECEKMCDFDVGVCTYEQVDYLSRTLFSDDGLEEFENGDADTSMKLGIAFAIVVARLLAAVYGKTGCDSNCEYADTVEDVLYYADIDPFTKTHEGLNKGAIQFRRYLAQRRQIYENHQHDDDGGGDGRGTGQRHNKRMKTCDGEETTTNESTVLLCKNINGDEVTRTLQQCMDSFAVGTLWYLSYSMFYFRSPLGRKLMSTTRNTENDIPMNVGLCLGRERTFLYNDERLSLRHDVRHLLELKYLLRNLPNICTHYWIIESAFNYALELSK